MPKLLAALAALVFLADVVVLVRTPLPDNPLLGVHLSADSPDWLAEAYAFQGTPTTHGDRPPLLPLVYAGLDALGAARLIAIFHPLVFFALVAFVSLLGWEAGGARAGALAGILTLLSGKIFYQSFILGGDVLATALSAGCAVSLLASVRRPKLAGIFVLTYALALSAQNVLPILLPALAVLVLRSWSRFASSGTRWTCAAALVLVPAVLALGHLWNARASGERAYGIHLPYLGFGWDGLAFYPLCVVSLLGVAGPLAMAALGAKEGWGGSPERRGAALLSGVWLLSWALFFGVFYRWLTMRFVVYAAPPAFALSGVLLARLVERGRVFFAGGLVGLHAWLGLLTHVEPYRATLPVAPGVAVAADLSLDPARAPRWRLLRGPASLVAPLHEILFRPETIPMSELDKLFWSRAEVRELVALSHVAPRFCREIALVDPVHGVTNRYFLSAAFRARVKEPGPAAGPQLLVARRGSSVPAGYSSLAETPSFQLFEAVWSGEP